LLAYDINNSEKSCLQEGEFPVMKNLRVSCASAFMFALISLGLCLPGEVNAQVAGSAIAGVVRDSTGGVLPGVTVEASSPALIEGVRAGVARSLSSAAA